MQNHRQAKQHMRESLLFCYNLKKFAAEAHRLMTEAYGEHAENGIDDLRQVTLALRKTNVQDSLRTLKMMICKELSKKTHTKRLKK